MTDQQYKHEYQIGDAVLAHINDLGIPGVIEDKQGDRVLVRLSESWTDATGQKSDEAWVTADGLDPWIQEETGGTGALPS